MCTTMASLPFAPSEKTHRHPTHIMRDNQPIASAIASIASWDALFPSLAVPLNNFRSGLRPLLLAFGHFACPWASLTNIV
jgi:hypothetical protein